MKLKDIKKKKFNQGRIFSDSDVSSEISSLNLSANILFKIEKISFFL